MKKSFVDRTLRIGAVVAVCSASVLHDKAVRAYPTDSPSAQAAARLKNRPPANWIRHYLPDDRYKIAGRIWKVISTETDELYHRADCVEMLKGDAGTVIGFASSADANEAGYRPDGVCRPQAPAFPATTTSGNANARRNGTRPAASSASDRPQVRRDGFSAMVRALAAVIAKTSTTRELQRLERRNERLKAGYIGQGDGDRAAAVDWLLVAIRQKAAGPNPAGMSSLRNSLRVAQFAADEVSRRATLTPEEAEREQERFNRRLMMRRCRRSRVHHHDGRNRLITHVK